MFPSPGQSLFDKLLEKATSNMLLEPDWASIMQICDLIRQKDCPAKYAVGVMKNKLCHPNPRVVLFDLMVLESAVKNCGSTVQEEIVTKSFMEKLRKLVKTTQHENVRDKILDLIQAWAHALRKLPGFPAFQDVVNIMKAEGTKFPAKSEPEAMFKTDNAPESADGGCCQRCRVKFDLVNRKHDCRACGQIFCANCFSNTATLPNFGIEKEARVCDSCFEKHRTLNMDTSEVNLDNLIFTMETGGSQCRKEIIRRLLATIPPEELPAMDRFIPRLKIKHLKKVNPEVRKRRKDKDIAHNSRRKARNAFLKAGLPIPDYLKLHQQQPPQQQPQQQQPQQQQPQQQPPQQQSQQQPQQQQSQKHIGNLKKGVFYKLKDRESIIPKASVLGYMLVDDTDADNEVIVREVESLDEGDEIDWGDEEIPSTSAGVGGAARKPEEILDKQAYPSNSSTVRWWVKFGTNVVAIDVEFVQVLKEGLVEGVDVQYFNGYLKSGNRKNGPSVGWNSIRTCNGRGLTESKAATISIIGWDLKPVCPKIYIRHAKGSYVNNEFTRSVNGFGWDSLDREEYYTLEEAAELVKTHIQGKLVVTHSGEKDFSAIGLRSGDYSECHFDITYEWHGKPGKSGKVDNARIGLKKLAQHYLKWKIQENAHCSEEDAVATMRLFKEIYVDIKTVDVDKKINANYYDDNFKLVTVPMYVDPYYHPCDGGEW